MSKKATLPIAYSPIYAHPLPEGHRFPMLKYELIPGQLLYEGVIAGSDLFAPEPCTNESILLTHTTDYLHKLDHQLLSAREQRVIGFPQSPELTLREKIITQGTIECCYKARETGVALNVAGGTHHAFADHGEGFCLLNDFAVAANVLLHRNEAQKILIIDLDVHQGNGTASLFSQEPRVFTFSMHGAHNYPFHKEVSDCDVPLIDGIADEAYLHLLEEHLCSILESHPFDFAFYLSGVDILDTDQFGKLKVSLEGCRLRDRFVFQQLKQRGIPCVVAMGGGYSRDVRRIVDAHCNTFREAQSVFALHG
jgi:acetoin utilization deacetylase AcuC-like enzyme